MRCLIIYFKIGVDYQSKMIDYLSDVINLIYKQFFDVKKDNYFFVCFLKLLSVCWYYILFQCNFLDLR